MSCRYGHGNLDFWHLTTYVMPCYYLVAIEFGTHPVGGRGTAI
ncbi:hypothetical protein [Microseira wollei]|nr:hypothetical protein [Microseira wollei]